MLSSSQLEAILQFDTCTIANAIGDFGVPAGGVFYGGQHAMAITGVRTDAVSRWLPLRPPAWRRAGGRCRPLGL